MRLRFPHNQRPRTVRCAHGVALGEPGRDALPIWFLSYEEIRSAIESGDPERIANIAARYGANLVVLPRPVRDARFLPVFSGTRWHAYRIGTGNGAVEARPS